MLTTVHPRRRPCTGPDHLRLILPVLVCLVLIPVQRSWAQGEVVVETTANPSTITIGDRVTYTVRMIVDPGITLESSRYIPFDQYGFEYQDYEIDKDPKTKGGRRIYEDHYILSTYVTGDYTIPPHEIRYKTADGQEKTVSTAPIQIKVESVSSSDGEIQMDVLDIKPPRPIKPRYDWLVLAAGGGFTALVVLGLVVLYVVHRLQKTPPPPPPVLPHDRALAALQDLKESGIVREGKVKEFSTEVSFIIRDYIDGRFGIPAQDRTTEETLRSLEEHPEAREHLEEFGHFFDSCDLVKFAGDLFRWDDLHSVIDEAYTLVEETKHVPRAAGSSEAVPRDLPEENAANSPGEGGQT